MYDRVESNIRALKALGVPTESYGTLLSSALVKKLPRELRLLVSRRITDDWDLSAIMKIVGEELEARERAETSSEGPTQKYRTGVSHRVNGRTEIRRET